MLPTLLSVYAPLIIGLIFYRLVLVFQKSLSIDDSNVMATYFAVTALCWCYINFYVFSDASIKETIRKQLNKILFKDK